jgi:hypothetical protein
MKTKNNENEALNKTDVSGSAISDIGNTRIVYTKFNYNSRILYRFNFERVLCATNF